MESVDTVVVGAGHNGLVTAFYLARAGQRVLVLEGGDRVGGAVGTEEFVPGFRFSVGAHVLRYLLPQVITDMHLADRGVKVRQPDPYRVHLYPDGSGWTEWPARERTAAELERFASGASRGLARYRKFWTRASALYRPYWLTDPPTDEDLHRRSAELGNPGLYERLRTGTMVDLVREHFADERIQGAFIGAPGDPRQPGSMLEAAMYSSATTDPQWVGLLDGGMGSLAMALAEAARDEGVMIRTRARVRRILVEDGRAIGIELIDGSVVRAEVVISNVAPKTTFRRLIEPGAIDDEYLGKIDAISTTIGYFKLLVALREAPDLSRCLGSAYHPRSAAYMRICPSIDYYVATWDTSSAGRVPAEPVLQPGSMSVYDPTMAPPGGHSIAILGYYVPPEPTGSWDDLRRPVAEAVIDLLDSYIPNFRTAMVGYVMNTPLDYERGFGMSGGSIDHGDHLPGQFFTGRPFPGSGGWRTPIAGLYLCGAGTHPGGEVSGAPGFNAANAILADKRVPGAGRR